MVDADLKGGSDGEIEGDSWQLRVASSESFSTRTVP